MSLFGNDAWLRRLKNLECPNATYAAPEGQALVMERARGSLVWDVEGREYIDLCAGFGALPLGHADPSVWSKLGNFSQVENMPPIVHGLGDVYPSRAKIEFLETLRSLLPKHLERGALALSGSQAVELAIKTALLASGRRGVIAFEGAYHGVELGVLPVTWREDFRNPFQSWLKQDQIRFLPYGATEKTLRDAMKEMAARGFPVGAILVEPVAGRAGVIVPPTGWLASLRRVCDEGEALLIFDEVFVGMGRCGVTSFTHEVAADLTCLGKAIGGGMPLSACFGTTAAMSAWPECEGESIHTGTFFGHPLSCMIGKWTLDQVVSRKLSERAQRLGDGAMKILRTELAGVAAVKEIRGQGLMIALEFVRDGMGSAMMNILRAEGVIVLPSGPRGESLSLTPALTIDDSLLNVALRKIISAVRAFPL